jgi:hypothetical protein
MKQPGVAVRNAVLQAAVHQNAVDIATKKETTVTAFLLAPPLPGAAAGGGNRHLPPEEDVVDDRDLPSTEICLLPLPRSEWAQICTTTPKDG